MRLVHSFRLGRAARLAAIASAACLSLLAGCRSGTPTDKGVPAPPPLTSEQRELNAQSFDQVWVTVKTRHWDRALGGLDWDKVKTDLRPKVEQAATMDEARGIMREALAKLGQSHFGIIDGDAYEHVAVDTPGSGASKGASTAVTSADVSATSGREGSAGLSIRIINGEAVVWSVAPESAASLAGVKPGWIVTSVKGAATAPVVALLTAQFDGQEAGDAMIVRGLESRFRGDAGERIKAVFLDGNDQPVEKELELLDPPGEVSRFSNLPPVHVKLSSTRLPGNIGYVTFNYFLDPARITPQFGAAIDSFASTEGVIIDLRGNPGGLGVMASGMCGFFIEKDGLKLGEMHMRDTTLNFVIFPRPQVYKGPLAILVDGLSLSTSEIMAGGLQDLGRARIFGERTGGAALPSLIEKLPNGDGFQFAMANYISASGRVLEGQGVAPDEEVHLDRATLLSGKDPVVEAASTWIRTSPAASN